MDGFSINYMIISKRLKEVGEHINLLTKELSKLAVYVENLDIFWDGDANNAYKIRVFRDINRLSESMAEVVELMELCDSALKSYQDTEKVISQMIGGFKIEKQE